MSVGKAAAKDPAPSASTQATSWRSTVWLSDAAVSERNSNNFDVLRLVAALLVVFGHCFLVVGGEAPLLNAGAVADWGNLGVIVFFAISGFLVSRSWTFDPRVLSFAVKRFLRIWPALVVALLFIALILGTIVTSAPKGAYIQDPGTKFFVLGNAVMFTQFLLPEVFTSNPVKVVDQPLWTLAPEVKAYVLVALLGVLGVYRRWPAVIVALALLFAAILIRDVQHALPFGDSLVSVMYDLQSPTVVRQGAHAGVLFEYSQVFAAFMIGAALFVMRHRVPLRWDLVALAVIVVAATAAIDVHGGRIAATWLIPYVVLVLAYRTHEYWSLPDRFGDYSYGIYILAFPIQQALVQWTDTESAWVVLALTLPIVFVLAALSWRFVEAPALTLKSQIIPALDSAAGQARHPEAREELLTARGAPAGQ